MKICFLTGGGEGEYSSSQGLIHGLKSLGHDVWSLGRRYYDRCLTDVELPHREHPEYYSYKEVLDRCPWFPDLAICFDPGGFFIEYKPKDLKSILISTDAHRSGAMLRRVIQNGSYDIFFNMQPNYSHFFTDIIPVVVHLPAFDDRRFSRDVNIDPVVDIAFCGQTGLALTKEHWENPDGWDEVGRYISDLKRRLPNDTRKYGFSFLPSYDYSERGELLYRLSQDFSVRIYEPLWDERLQLALQKGRIGFNRSILNDYSIRNWEVGASGRLLVTDDIKCGPWPVFTSLWHSGLYKPFYENFSLEYEQVRKKVTFALGVDYDPEDREYPFVNHTWVSRAKFLTEEILTNKTI